jgi:hypothetical protein
VYQLHEDASDRAYEKQNAGYRLNEESGKSLLYGLTVASEVDDTANNPDDASGGGGKIIQIESAQPQRDEKSRHPFERIYMHTAHPLESAFPVCAGRLTPYLPCADATRVAK